MNLNQVPVDHVNFSVRAMRAAQELNCKTLAELDKISDRRLMLVPAVGVRILHEIRRTIEEYRAKPDIHEQVSPVLMEEVARAITIMSLVDKLRADEGHSVTICSDNPDFNGLPNCCVIVNGYQTEWENKEYRADTLVDCLRLAVRDLDIYRFTELVK